MNHTENARLAPEGAVLLEPPEASTLNNKPQKMKVWVGMKLLGCVNISDEYTTNGLEYEVLGVSDKIRLRKLDPSKDQKHGEPFELSYEETALRMRPQHALVYYSSEGRNFRDGLCVLYDTSHKYFYKEASDRRTE